MESRRLLPKVIEQGLVMGTFFLILFILSGNIVYAGIFHDMSGTSVWQIQDFCFS